MHSKTLCAEEGERATALVQNASRETRPGLSAGSAATTHPDADEAWQRLQRSLRQSEKRSRVRRIERIQTMQKHLDMLGRVMCVLPLVNDTDTIWDDFLDGELKRTRDCVRRLLPGFQAIQKLKSAKMLLGHLLQEHVLVMRALRACEETERASASSLDDWARFVQRWDTLTRVHFRPWTLEQCEHEIQKATAEMNQFLLSSDKQSSGLSFMGWEDSRHIDSQSSRFQFTLEKTFFGLDIDYYIASSWRIYTEASVFRNVVMGGRAKLSFEVLQEVRPMCCLVRFVESYATLPPFVHRIYLIARVDTDDGAVQFMRSVRVSEIERVINQPRDSWAADFFWMRWEVLDKSRPRSSTDFVASLGGTMVLADVTYLQYWLFELLGAIVRAEAWSTNRPLLEF